MEAIVSHRRNKNYALNYLLKWSDHSKGETWESVKITSDICPQLLKEYNKKLEEEDLKANEVEHKSISSKILQYKFELRYRLKIFYRIQSARAGRDTL